MRRLGFLVAGEKWKNDKQLFNRIETFRSDSEKEIADELESLAKAHTVLNDVEKASHERLSNQIAEGLTSMMNNAEEEELKNRPIMKERIRKLSEWKHDNDDKAQTEQLVEIYKKMELAVDGTFINIKFDELNNASKTHLFPKLLEFLKNVVGKWSMTDKFQFSFRVNSNWVSMPLTPALYQRL
jgi:hypothetical protein